MRSHDYQLTELTKILSTRNQWKLLLEEGASVVGTLGEYRTVKVVKRTPTSYYQRVSVDTTGPDGRTFRWSYAIGINGVTEMVCPHELNDLDIFEVTN